MDAQVNTRRTDSSAVSGCVTFPIEGEYRNTALGGMYVQLVAIEKRSEAENWWDEPNGKSAKQAKAIYDQ